MVAAVQIKIDRKADTYLRALGARVKDLSPAMRDIGHEFVEEIRLGFRTSTSPNGVRWAPLRYRAGQPLLDTGTHLRNPMAYRANRSSVEIGSNFEYAGVHQHGATIKPKRGKFLKFTPPGFSHPIFAKKVTIPARPFLPVGELPPDWQRDMLDILRDHFYAR
jgi:phage gpG-like protein